MSPIVTAHGQKKVEGNKSKLLARKALIAAHKRSNKEKILDTFGTECAPPIVKRNFVSERQRKKQSSEKQTEKKDGQKREKKKTQVGIKCLRSKGKNERERGTNRK